MPSRLLSFLQTMVPFRGTLGGDDSAVRILRMSLVITAVLNPLFWAVYRATSPDAFDPAWLRVVGVVGVLGVLALTYRNGRIYRHPQRTLGVVVHTLLLWFGVLAATNDLAADYAIGYCFVVLAAAMVYSLVWSSPRPLALMLVAAVGIAAVVAVAVDPGAAGVSPASFMLVLVSGGSIVYLAFLGRLQAVRALKTSESRLADAERLAGTGSWTLDVGTQHRTWSDGMYRIFGIDPSEPPVSMSTLVHPDDWAILEADKAQLYREEETGDHRFRIVRPDGEVRTIRSIVRLTRDRSGAPEHLTGAFLDITDQVAHEEALQAALDRAEAAAEAKTTFLANMSHEIRTPLTAIIGFAQILADELGEAHADLVEPIETGGRRLLGTLNSVLDLSRMEAGETDLDLVVTDLAREAREVARMLRSQAETKGLTLVVDAPDAGLAVLADPDALARVLTNLVSNAVKFTERGGITLALRRVGDRVEVAVDDTGRGMDAAFLTELFEPFRQASTGWARSHEGTGLGLTITRELVHAMDGTIEVTSEPGVGTRFLVSLPAAQAETAERTEVSAPERVAA